MTIGPPHVSVIIPLLDDSAQLAHAFETIGRDSRVEVIVVNGGATDAKLAELKRQNPHMRWLDSSAGRGRQMNIGAAHARGGWLVFLHADTQLPRGWLEEVESVARDPMVIGGSFSFHLDATSRWARLVERGVAARVRWLHLPYGDQALFVRRDVFASLGGYRELELMEDVEFVRRLNRAGRLHHSELPAVTSGRRWERDGWIRRSLENVALLVLYYLGVSPRHLAHRYRSQVTKPR